MWSIKLSRSSQDPSEDLISVPRVLTRNHAKYVSTSEYRSDFLVRLTVSDKDVASDVNLSVHCIPFHTS